MRRSSPVLCGGVIAVVLLACPLVARAEMSVGLIGGVMATDSGALTGGGLRGEWLFTERFGAEARVGYLFAPDGSGTAIPLEAALVGVLPLEKASLSASAGVGYYLYDPDLDVNLPSGVDLKPDPKVGFFGALGVRYPIGQNVKFYAEAKYTAAKYEKTVTQGRSTYSTKGGLDGIGANVGVMWSY